MLTLIVLAWIAFTALGISGLAWWNPTIERWPISSESIQHSLDSTEWNVDSSKRLVENT